MNVVIRCLLRTLPWLRERDLLVATQGSASSHTLRRLHRGTSGKLVCRRVVASPAQKARRVEGMVEVVYVTSLFISHCWAERGVLRPGICRR